ncbi:PaaI family thioesterase [Mumia zhuanghuii]|uniref:PaaI family thioesterase n=2 Tax=Mumia TaxID=1546255 RepID=A0ABW1QGI8_9ACTN|nr:MULTISPECIES: PaaI family thioesterase [Mumia]KAA1424755.1 PaaI family thioesterase [Mumia zhuanghuii]
MSATTTSETTTTETTPPSRVEQAVLAMPMAQTLGLRFRHLGAGESEIELPVSDGLTFRPGQLQATAVYAVADFAAVSAAGTTLPLGWINATVDTSLKLVAPAVGEVLVARGRVVSVSRLLTVCAADVYAVADGVETLCATMIATARNVDPRRAAAPSAA